MSDILPECQLFCISKLFRGFPSVSFRGSREFYRLPSWCRCQCIWFFGDERGKSFENSPNLFGKSALENPHFMFYGS